MVSHLTARSLKGKGRVGALRRPDAAARRPYQGLSRSALPYRFVSFQDEGSPS